MATCLMLLTVFPVHADGSHVQPGVVVRDGRFVIRETGELFRPVGFNYIRLFNEQRTADHDNFSRTGYDVSEHAIMLRRLAANGFNTVRVFINFQPGEVIEQRDSTELSASYLDNITDFLARAKTHGVYVMLSMRRHPNLPRYVQLRDATDGIVTGENRRFLRSGWIRAKTRYMQDFLTEIVRRNPQALSAVFAVDIQNEVCLYPSQKPFSLTEGEFTAPDGRTYDLATQKQELADGAAIHFVNVCADAIHEVFPGVLVNVNVFTYAAVGRSGPCDFHEDNAAWRNRIPFRPLAIVGSRADMVDVHFYTSTLDGYQRDLESIEFDELKRAAKAAGKPLIVGEFGLFKSQFNDNFDAACRFLKHEWLPALNHDWQGWLYWTYDTHEQRRLWNAADREFAIFEMLAAECMVLDDCYTPCSAAPARPRAQSDERPFVIVAEVNDNASSVDNR